MAQPKRRWSKQRTHTRRSTWKIDAPNVISCPNCKEATLPHTVCPTCGFYDKKQVVVIKDKTKKEA